MASQLERRIGALEQPPPGRSLYRLADEELLARLGLEPDATNEQIAEFLQVPMPTAPARSQGDGA